MLTKVCNLNEIVTSLPDNPRRFVVDDTNPTWVDLGKVVIAKVFDGNLVIPSGDGTSVDRREKFIELYWQGTVGVVTLFTDEVKNHIDREEGC